MLDRTKVLHGPQTQTYGETSYFKKVQVLDRTKVLHDPQTQTYGETSYFKKTILAVVQATRKPSHCFQEHTVLVATQLPLRSTLWNIDYVGRIAKRGAVLGTSDVKCVPRALVNGLILAGLVVRFTEFPSEKEAEGQTRIFWSG